MEATAAILIGATILGSVAALTAYTRRRHWNVDGQDDARRPKEDEAT